MNTGLASGKYGCVLIARSVELTALLAHSGFSFPFVIPHKLARNSIQLQKLAILHKKKVQ